MSEKQRETVLDADKVYQENARLLLGRYRQGKITSLAFNHIQQWLAAAAVRRVMAQQRRATV